MVTNRPITVAGVLITVAECPMAVAGRPIAVVGVPIAVGEGGRLRRPYSLTTGMLEEALYGGSQRVDVSVKLSAEVMITAILQQRQQRHVTYRESYVR